MPLTTLTDESFDAAIAAWPGLVLLELTARWCPPCRAMKPTLEALADARPDVKVAALDVDDAPRIGQRYGARAMPTFLVLRGGVPIAQRVGACDQRALEALLDA